ncbi:retrovirus-related pol polyprotein from transposon TNT 1-94 [Tanacetum coccineum]
MALISLSFKKIYKPTNNNLRTSSNTSRANQDNSPRINRGTGYDNQMAFNVTGARENVGTPVVQKSGIQCYNCKEYGHISREYKNPKRVKDATYHKKKMLLCKQEKARVQLNAEQANWKDDTDDESDDQDLEAHYILHRHNFKCYSGKWNHPEATESSYDYLGGTSFAKTEFLKNAQRAKPRMNDIETWEKCEHLEKELSKSRTMSKSFEALQKHAINLELDLQQCKEKIKNDKSFKENQSNVFLKEREQYFEIQDLKAQLQDKGIAINSLAKKDFSKSKPVTTQNVNNDFSKPVTAQILPQNMLPIVKNTNVIAPGMYKVHTKPTQTRTPQLHQDIRKPNKRVSFSTGVIPNTRVSRPQLKSNHLEDRVMSNNSQGKKQEVEDHHRKFKFSNNKTSCVLNGQSVLCVLTLFNGVMLDRHPKLWTISTREPKHNVNQSVATFRTVKFGNDQIAPILGYGDLVQGTITIKRVYYVEGLNHNLFSVGQFCDADLEVAFRKSTCYIRDLKGNDLLKGSRGTDLYSITLQDSTTPNPICLMAKATSSQAWLWHRRLSHLNFDTINLLSKNNIVNGLPKLKFVKDHLCSSCGR